MKSLQRIFFFYTFWFSCSSTDDTHDWLVLYRETGLFTSSPVGSFKNVSFCLIVFFVVIRSESVNAVAECVKVPCLTICNVPILSWNIEPAPPQKKKKKKSVIHAAESGCWWVSLLNPSNKLHSSLCCCFFLLSLLCHKAELWLHVKVIQKIDPQ